MSLSYARFLRSWNLSITPSDDFVLLHPLRSVRGTLSPSWHVGANVRERCAIWPLAVRAQQPAGKLPRIGSIQNFRNENFQAFIEGLREAGYMDGQNIVLETRFYSGAVD